MESHNGRLVIALIGLSPVFLISFENIQHNAIQQQSWQDSVLDELENLFETTS